MAHDDQQDTSVSGDTTPTTVSRDERRAAFGARLKAARTNQELSVTALGQMTRISIAFIDALEAGDFARLPGAVFGRGFVRSIARTTSLPAEEAASLVQEFDELWEREAPKSVLKVEIKNKPNVQRGEAFMASLGTAGSLLRRGLGFRLVVPSLVFIVCVGAVVANPGMRLAFKERVLKSGSASVATPVKTLDLAPKPEDQALNPDAAPEAVTESVAKVEPATPEVAPVVAADAPAAAVEATKPIESPAPAAKEVAVAKGEQVLELTVLETVRVRIEVDDGQQVTKELEPDTYRFTFASKADLMVYDAAALRVSYNGRQLGPLGNKGRVRRLSFDAGLAEPQKL